MRLYVVSDLHQEFAAFTPPKVDCDVVILAGDINLKRHGLHWAMATFPDKPVLYVFGNHEFYGEKYPRLIEKGRDLVKGSNVRILENEMCEIDGWRFFGATLWSDYSWFGDPFDSIEAAQRVTTDFKKIRHWPTLKRFQPQHVRQAHVNSKNALRDFLQSGARDRSVVINKEKIDSLTRALVSLENPLPPDIGSDIATTNDLRQKLVPLGTSSADAPWGNIIAEAAGYRTKHPPETNCPLCEKEA